MTLPRGFKARAEREALRYRSDLGLSASAPLGVHQLAVHLGVQAIDGADLLGRAQFEELERLQAFAFSAATFDVGQRSFIVTNPLRTPERQASDIAHELSHLLLDHDLSEVREVGGVAFRTCKPDQEEQATVFGGTLLLPRPLLLAAASRGLAATSIASELGVTVEMARFRYNSTGVARQMAHRA